MGTIDPPNPDPPNENQDDRSLAEIVHGAFSEVDVDSVEAVREVRESD